MQRRANIPSNRQTPRVKREPLVRIRKKKKRRHILLGFTNFFCRLGRKSPMERDLPKPCFDSFLPRFVEEKTCEKNVQKILYIFRVEHLVLLHILHVFSMTLLKSTIDLQNISHQQHLPPEMRFFFPVPTGSWADVHPPSASKIVA